MRICIYVEGKPITLESTCGSASILRSKMSFKRAFSLRVESFTSRCMCAVMDPMLFDCSECPWLRLGGRERVGYIHTYIYQSIDQSKVPDAL